MREWLRRYEISPVRMRSFRDGRADQRGGSVEPRAAVRNCGPAREAVNHQWRLPLPRSARRVTRRLHAAMCYTLFTARTLVVLHNRGRKRLVWYQPALQLFRGVSR